MMFVILIVVFVAFVFYGNKYAITQPYYEKLFGQVKMEQDTVGNTVAINNDWCVAADLYVSTHMEEPISSKILGWDNINQCCILETVGYNCALHNESVLQSCFTSNMGGDIKSVKANGKIVDSAKYQEFYLDLDKFTIENKICDASKY